jgi:hypothetical protein
LKIMTFLMQLNHLVLIVLSSFFVQWPVWSVEVPVSPSTSTVKVEYKYVKTSDHRTVTEWEQVCIPQKVCHGGRRLLICVLPQVPNRVLDLSLHPGTEDLVVDDGTFGHLNHDPVPVLHTLLSATLCGSLSESSR